MQAFSAFSAADIELEAIDCLLESLITDSLNVKFWLLILLYLMFDIIGLYSGFILFVSGGFGIIELLFILLQ